MYTYFHFYILKISTYFLRSGIFYIKNSTPHSELDQKFHSVLKNMYLFLVCKNGSMYIYSEMVEFFGAKFRDTSEVETSSLGLISNELG
jgi:hypothetical protein